MVYIKNGETVEDGIKLDPKERSPRYGDIIEQAGKEAEANLKDLPKGLGFCYSLWAEKKRILREKCGINWKRPKELNPYVLFD